MWEAKLISVTDDLGKTLDSLRMLVEFSHPDTRRTTREYIIYLDDLADVTLPSLRSQVQADLDRLAKLDQIKNALVSKIGKVI